MFTESLHGSRKFFTLLIAIVIVLASVVAFAGRADALAQENSSSSVESPDKPDASDDTYTVKEDDTLVVEADGVLENDTDPNGRPLHAELKTDRVPAPQNGTLTLNEDGSFTYVPNPDFFGTETFEYEACNNLVPEICDEGIVTITVDAENDPPVANDDSAATDEDTAVVVDVKANDTSGPDNESGQSLTVDSATVPANGTAEIIPTGDDAGKVRYTPNADFNGPDSFQYTVCDDGAPSECATAAVGITVNPIDDAARITLNGANTVNEGSTKTYFYKVQDVDGAGSVVRSCGQNASMVSGSLINTEAGGSFKCFFPDGPKTTEVSVAAGAPVTALAANSSLAGSAGKITVKVKNVAPRLSMKGPAAAKQGQKLGFRFTITDPGKNDRMSFAPGYPKCGKGAKMVGRPAITSGVLRCAFVTAGVRPVLSIQVKDSDGAMSNRVNWGVRVAAAKPPAPKPAPRPDNPKPRSCKDIPNKPGQVGSTHGGDPSHAGSAQGSCSGKAKAGGS